MKKNQISLNYMKSRKYAGLNWIKWTIEDLISKL